MIRALEIHKVSRRRSFFGGNKAECRTKDMRTDSGTIILRSFKLNIKSAETLCEKKSFRFLPTGTPTNEERK